MDDHQAAAPVTSRGPSPRARRFAVLDLTPEQREAGRSGAAREGIDNVEFVEGDAARTPFADAAFDLGAGSR